MTGKDYGPYFSDDYCWNCGGEGYVYNCLDPVACLDPDGGCDDCMRRCEFCNPRKPKVRPDSAGGEKL